LTIAHVAVAVAALVLVGSAARTIAQTDAPYGPDIQAQVQVHRAELDAITQNIAVSHAREAELRKEIEALDRDRASLDQALVDAGAEVKRLEAALDQSEGRLSALLRDEDRLRASLASRREVLADVLAALQRMGDHPPPALLVRPEDALSAVRSAILLGAVVPNVRNAADELAADLDKLVALRADQERERDQLKADAEKLVEGRTRIALLIDDTRRQRDTDAAALADEQTRAEELAAQATTLRDLVARLEVARVPAAPLTTGSIPPPQTDLPGSRLKPSVAFADARGELPMPANGRLITAFGDPNGLGGRAQGISLATRAGAEIVAPADGTVAYAGEFRSYGQLLIINVGGGYHVVLAGMERIDVQLGQFVLAGEPVAAMASQRLASAGATLVGTTEPVLYVEFRKDGASIDPAPWWAASNPEKVGG
jgi:septal ring factor EnvC (AmiA/AmiB activator)